MPLYPSMVTRLPSIVVTKARGVRFTVSPSRSRIVRDASRVAVLAGKYGAVFGESSLMPGIIAIRGGIGGMRQLTADASRCVPSRGRPPPSAPDALRAASRSTPGDTGVVRSRCASKRALGEVPRSTSRPVRLPTSLDRSALIKMRNCT